MKKKVLENPRIDMLYDFFHWDKNGVFLINDGTGSGKSESIRRAIKKFYVNEIKEKNVINTKFVIGCYNKKDRDEVYLKLSELTKEIHNTHTDKNIFIHKLISIEDSIIDFYQKYLSTNTQKIEYYGQKIIDCFFTQLTIEELNNTNKNEFNTSAYLFMNNISDVFESLNNIYLYEKRIQKDPLLAEGLNLKLQELHTTKEKAFNECKKCIKKALRRKYKQINVDENGKKQVIFSKEQMIHDFQSKRDIDAYVFLFTLFPDLLTSCANVIVCTHDKLISNSFDLYIDNSPLFISHKYHENIIYCVDESVKFYESLENKIIESSSNYTVPREALSELEGLLLSLKQNEDTYDQFILSLFKNKINLKNEQTVLDILQEIIDKNKDYIKINANIFSNVTDSDLFHLLPNQKTPSFLQANNNGKNCKPGLCYTPCDYKNFDIQKIDFNIIHKDFIRKGNYELASINPNDEKNDNMITLTEYIKQINHMLNMVNQIFYNKIIPLYFSMSIDLRDEYSIKTPSWKDALNNNLISPEIIDKLLTTLFHELSYNTNNLKTNSLFQSIKDYCIKNLYFNKNNSTNVERNFMQSDVDLLTFKKINSSKYYDFEYTSLHLAPEDYLLAMCEAKVVLISATNQDYSIDNFAHCWLENLINYYNPKKEQLQRLAEYKKYLTVNDKLIRRHYFSIDDNLFQKKENWKIELYESLKQNECFVEKEFNPFSKNNSNKYQIKELSKVISIIQVFLSPSNTKMQNLLCFLNKHIPIEHDQNKWYYSPRTINTIFLFFCEKFKINPNDYNINGNYFHTLRAKNQAGENLSEQFKVVQKRFQSGKRTLIFTTYKTASAALNLILPLPNKFNSSSTEFNVKLFNERFIRIHDMYNSYAETDINGFYFSKPTNFFVSHSTEINSEDYITNKETIKQTIVRNARRIEKAKNVTCEISYPLYCELLNTISSSQIPIPLATQEQLRSYYWKTLEILYQALGRGNRTPCRENEKFLLCDNNLKIPNYYIEHCEYDKTEDWDFILKQMAPQNRVESNDEIEININSSIQDYLKQAFNKQSMKLKTILNPYMYDNKTMQNVENVNSFINGHILLVSPEEMVTNNGYYYFYFKKTLNKEIEIDIDLIWLKSIEDKNENVKYDVIYSQTPPKDSNYIKYKDLLSIYRKINSNHEILHLLKLKGYQILSEEDYSNYYYFPTPHLLFKVRGNMGETLAKYYLEKVFCLNLEKSYISNTNFSIEENQYKTFEKMDYYDNQKQIAVEIKNYSSYYEKTLSYQNKEMFFKKYFRRMKENNINKLILLNTFKTSLSLLNSYKKIDNGKEILIVPFFLNEDGSYSTEHIEQISNFIGDN